MVVAGANEQPLSLMQRAGFVSSVGAENFVVDFAAALLRAASVADPAADAVASAVANSVASSVASAPHSVLDRG